MQLWPKVRVDFTFVLGLVTFYSGNQDIDPLANFSETHEVMEDKKFNGEVQALRVRESQSVFIKFFSYLT